MNLSALPCAKRAARCTSPLHWNSLGTSQALHQMHTKKTIQEINGQTSNNNYNEISRNRNRQSNVRILNKRNQQEWEGMCVCAPANMQAYYQRPALV